MNETFDCLNIKNLYDKNLNRRPPSNNNSYIFNILEKTKLIFLEAEKINYINTTLSSTNKPPCFTGFVWSINAIIGLFNSEKSSVQNMNTDKSKEYFLLTNRLNQDPLENMFSIVRQKNGYNKNPTSRVFRSCFASICYFSLMKCAEHCNCEEDNDEYFTTDSLENVDITSNIEKTDELRETEEPLISNSCSTISTTKVTVKPLNDLTNLQPKTVTLKSCSVLYFIGYLAKKCINHFNCSNCKLNLILQDSLNDPNSLFLLNKTYDWVSSGGLYTPSPYLQELCNICLNVYQEHWNFIKSQQAILKTFLNFAIEKINEKYPNFNDHDYNEHLMYIFNLLFTTSGVAWSRLKCKQSPKIFPTGTCTYYFFFFLLPLKSSSLFI